MAPCNPLDCARKRIPVDLVAAALLGLTACDKPPDAEPAYGVMLVDNDEDGYEQDVDCDDEDPDRHPDAEETPGDGIDSNCNEDDDT